MSTMQLPDSRTVEIVREFPNADKEHYPNGLYMVMERGHNIVFFVDRDGRRYTKQSDPQADGFYYLTY